MISDAAADIGITPKQWSQIANAQKHIRKLNSEHNALMNSDGFRYNKSKVERERLVKSHAEEVDKAKPLLLKLMLINAGMLNPEINADIDDLLEDQECGKRLSRRIKRGYYNALARNCLKHLDIDPLSVFGRDADAVIKNIQKVSFSEVGEIKIGNKIHRLGDNSNLVTEDSKL